jgi:hypothetical protein
VALATGQPLSEVQSWDDADFVTVIELLEERAAAHGR